MMKWKLKMFSKNCLSGGKHKFEARYDEVEILLREVETKGYPVDEFRKLLIKNIYVKDICVHCGKEITK